MSGKVIQSMLIMAAMSLIIVACATDETQPDYLQVYNDDERDEVVCRGERTFGSRVVKLVCRTKGEIEEDQRRAMQMTGPLRTMGGDEPRRPPE